MDETIDNIAAIIRQCRNGDYEAFSKLLKMYQSRIFSVCYSMTRSRQDAEDLFQLVCMKMYRSLKNLRADKGVYVWIYRMTVNTSIDWIRKKKAVGKRNERVKNEVLFESRESETPRDVCLQVELRGQIDDALLKLPPKQRSVLVLREFEGLSYQEISRICGVSIGTVMSRLYHGRKKMCKYLKAYLREGQDE